VLCGGAGGGGGVFLLGLCVGGGGGGGGGFRMGNSWSECVTSAREIKLYVLGTVRCV